MDSVKPPVRIKAKVVGPVSVDGVPSGSYVNINPLFYNVRMLIEVGHIELSKEALKQLEDFENPPTETGPTRAESGNG